jgi:hypothetical protein
MKVERDPQIYEEWEKISLMRSMETSKQVLPKAWKLYSTWFQSGAWRCSVDDAMLIGDGLAFRLVRCGEFERADEVWDSVSRHPQFGFVNHAHLDRYFSNRAFINIVLGRVDEGLGFLREGASVLHKSQALACMVIGLTLASGEFGERATVDPRIREFVKELLLVSPRAPRNLVVEIEGCQIWRELDNVLSCYHLRSYARQIRAQEAKRKELADQDM